MKSPKFVWFIFRDPFFLYFFIILFLFLFIYFFLVLFFFYFKFERIDFIKINIQSFKKFPTRNE